MKEESVDIWAEFDGGSMTRGVKPCLGESAAEERRSVALTSSHFGRSSTETPKSVVSTLALAAVFFPFRRKCSILLVSGEEWEAPQGLKWFGPGVMALYWPDINDWLTAQHTAVSEYSQREEEKGEVCLLRRKYNMMTQSKVPQTVLSSRVTDENVPTNLDMFE
ncbi:hypothetical protein EYF80_020086 [Liparis tanakae]|uniref:Uncharacterized protein n=1 Tax=Liparis tanakae TaxID=230148 RepID=A0A4Z2HXR1_9TELE|nr:hypothetical protein EYF80_020086 [Liparis tanakae]